MMETRYYSEKGRPGGEHKLALHASRRVFDRITGHLDRKERIREDLAKEAAHRKYLRDATKAMTSQWENSVDNLRIKKEEARQQRLAQKADDRVEQYYKVLKSQAAEREAYNKEVSKKLFLLRGAQRDINSSVLRSECMYANEKHIEHKNKEKEKEEKDWKEYEQKIIEADKKFKEDELVKKCKTRAIAENYLKFLKGQMLEKQRIQENETKEKLETEISDILKQEEEMKIIKKNKEEDFLKAKRCSIKILEDARKEMLKKQAIEEKQNVEMETVCDIYRDTRTKLNCSRELMRKKEIQKRLDLQDKAFRKLEEIEQKKLDDEEQIISRAIAERDEADALKKRMREEYDSRLLRERKANYENALQNEKSKGEIQKETRKLEMLNRIKLKQVCEHEERERRESKLEKKENYKEMLDEQVKGNQEVRAEEKTRDDAFIWNDFPEKDKKFLKYGEEMLEKQKAAGKSTYPIEQAIMAYKKKHCLLPSKHFKIEERQKESQGVKLPLITRRICPNKNQSTGVQDCFCID